MLSNFALYLLETMFSLFLFNCGSLSWCKVRQVRRRTQFGRSRDVPFREMAPPGHYPVYDATLLGQIFVNSIKEVSVSLPTLSALKKEHFFLLQILNKVSACLFFVWVQIPPGARYERNTYKALHLFSP